MYILHQQGTEQLGVAFQCDQKARCSHSSITNTLIITIISSNISFLLASNEGAQITGNPIQLFISVL